MTILLSDPVVRTIPVRESGEPLVRLHPRFGPARAPVRRSVAERLERARASLPVGLGLRVVEGHRSPDAQQAIITAYVAQLLADHPTAGESDIERLASRYVAPLAVAPHVAGAAVDLTLVDDRGAELDLGSPLDATPEQSGGRCWFDADVHPVARAHRELLGRALRGSGMVNYPTEWWHWSYGDRYWAVMTGAEAARFGPVSWRDPALEPVGVAT